MKILYVNDLRDLPNWGCRATGVALSQLLEKECVVIDRVGLETAHNSGWKRWAEPMLRSGGVLPEKLVRFGWKIRRTGGKLSDLIERVDKALGARRDFVTECSIESVANFHRMRKDNSRLQSIYQSMLDCDAVVINGEGTMIFRTPPERDSLFINFMLQLASDENRPVHFLNAMFSVCPFSKENEPLVKTTHRLLAGCASVGCRDAESLDFVRKAVDKQKSFLLPDALFTWRSKIQKSCELIKEMPDLVVTYPRDRDVAKLDLSRGYICLSGSSGAWKYHTEYIDAYEQLCVELKKLGLPVVLVETDDETFMHCVAEKTGLPLVPWQTPIAAGAGLVAGASVFVTGRFHPSIMASLGGTPAVYMGSNSHKNLTLQKVLEYPEPKEYACCPKKEDIRLIINSVHELLEKGEAERNRIREVVRRRDLQARQNLNAVLHMDVNSIEGEL